MFEERLEDVAQLTNEIDYNDAWALDQKASEDKDFREKVRAALDEYDDAVAEDDQDGMDAAGRKLKELVKECA
jgi:phage-related protein